MSLRLLVGPIALTLAVATLGPDRRRQPGCGRARRPRPRLEEHVDRGRQGGLRHGAHPAEQRVVHAPGRPGQRGVLPRPVDAEHPQPRARGDRRPHVHRPRDRGRRRGDHASRRAQPALPAGRHRDLRPVPDHQDVRHRPAPRRARRPRPPRVARRRQLPAVRRPRPRAGQLGHGRPRRARRGRPWWPPMRRSASRPPSSRVPASAGAAPASSVATTAGPTSRTTSASTRAAARRVRATSCRPAGSPA